MTCQICAAELPPGRHLCPRHRDELLDEVNRIDETLDDADVTIARQDRRGSGGGAANRPAETPMPVNLDVADRARELREATHTWARMCLEHDTEADRLRGVEPIAYLRMSLDLIAGQDWAGECYDEITRAHRRLVAAIDARPDWITLGECGSEFEGVTCTDTLRAKKGDTYARCRTCGATPEVAEVQRTRVSEAQHIKVPLALAVKAVTSMGIKVRMDTAKKWIKREKLHPAWVGQDGVKLYRVDDLHALAVESMKSAAKRGRHVA